MIEYRIYNEVYDNMVAGIKKVEFRLLTEKSKKIKIGDHLKFTVFDSESMFLIVEVTNLYHYKDIDDLWDNCSHLIIDKGTNKEDFKDLFYGIFGKEQVDSTTIIGIEFKILEIHN